MKFALALLVGNLPSLTCVFAAFYLAAKDKGGWGWFLFVAVLLMRSVHFKE